jgi:hypothetical protein
LFADEYGRFESLADLFCQIGHDERVHKDDSLARMGEPRFRQPARGRAPMIRQLHRLSEPRRSGQVPEHSDDCSKVAGRGRCGLLLAVNRGLARPFGAVSVERGLARDAE